MAQEQSGQRANGALDILLSFAVRGIFGARAQRGRMARAEVVTYDLDFYVFAAWQLRESGRQALRRLGIEDVRALLERLDEEVPLLKDYRDMMTHALDDRLSLANLAWFGPFAANLEPGGGVGYVVDRGIIIMKHSKSSSKGSRPLCFHMAVGER